MPIKTKSGKMTNKQEAFALEYVVDFNGKQAAIRAGYSPRNAESQASRLLRNAKVSELVQMHATARTEAVEVSIDNILKELTFGAHLDPLDFFEEDGTLKPLSKIPVHARRAICGIDFYTEGGGSDTQKVCKLKIMDKARCLELLGKYKSMWTERTEHKEDKTVTFVMKYHESIE
jgi:phage terminase small subunit